MTPHEVAKGLIGVPFLHRGRTRKGLDCAGVVIFALARAYGRDLDEPTHYPEVGVPRQVMMNWLKKHFRQLPGRTGVRVGDTALIRTADSISLAIVTPGEGAIFASRAVGRVTEISRIADLDFISYYRLKGT